MRVHAADIDSKWSTWLQKQMNANINKHLVVYLRWITSSQSMQQLYFADQKASSIGAINVDNVPCTSNCSSHAAHICCEKIQSNINQPIRICAWEIKSSSIIANEKKNHTKRKLHKQTNAHTKKNQGKSINIYVIFYFESLSKNLHPNKMKNLKKRQNKPGANQKQMNRHSTKLN